MLASLHTHTLTYLQHLYAPIRTYLHTYVLAFLHSQILINLTTEFLHTYILTYKMTQDSRMCTCVNIYKASKASWLQKWLAAWGEAL